MSLYSLYSILFLTFTVVFMIGFLFCSLCKDTQNMVNDKIFFRCNILCVFSLMSHYG